MIWAHDSGRNFYYCQIDDQLRENKTGYHGCHNVGAERLWKQINSQTKDPVLKARSEVELRRFEQARHEPTMINLGNGDIET